MKIIIDTLAISFKYNAVNLLYRLLHIADVADKLQLMRTKNYDEGVYYDGILIAYNKDMYGQITDSFLNASGKGCRTIEQLAKLADCHFDWYDFLYSFNPLILNRQVHIARIDVACDLDDTDPEIPYDRFYKYSYHEMYVCKSKILPDLRQKRTEVIYFGSSKSNRMLRIYNKALEMGLPDTYWMRLEFQLRNECATSFYLNWVQLYDKGIGFIFRGIMLDFLRFVDGDPDKIRAYKDQKHQQLLPTAKWWDQFLQDAEKIPQLYIPGEEYTLDRLDHYAEKNLVSTLKTYAIAHDGDLTNLIKAVEHAKLNTRQRTLLSQIQLLAAEIDSENKE